ncbi:MAG: aminoacyl-tRNA hydrolase [Deltaproteobacteria bacterium]|nr:aminoacyl-tRNA hydrolase [Deltaproteobacteria bacterium]MBI3293233.1 aminoacyl-tRNA hydrolase [Deltaproteobacteria bacterium]
MPSTHNAVLVGLGNPGPKYAKTRHNIGFEVIDILAKRLGVSAFQSKFQSHLADATAAGIRVLLVKPQTFMNISGQAVREVTSFYKLEPEKVIVIYDDLDLPATELRIRKFGGPGGHNGVTSIIESLGSDRFPRVRIGIGRGSEAADHVLSEFSKAERAQFDEAITRAADAVESILKDGIDKAMNQFNAKEAKE